MTMELSLENHKTVLPKELLKKAEKNKVRECDETARGHFIAYVDEGSESFDVSLNILPNKVIVPIHVIVKMGRRSLYQNYFQPGGRVSIICELS
jgi:hypothetical protein